MSDAILVEEDYCVTCEGKCINTDPDDYDHLFNDWDRLVGLWTDKGVSPDAAWAFLASVLMQIAYENDVSWKKIERTLKQAWDQGVAAEAAKDGEEDE